MFGWWRVLGNWVRNMRIVVVMMTAAAVVVLVAGLHWGDRTRMDV